MRTKPRHGQVGTFEEFATGVLQSVAKRCLSSRDYNSAKSVKKKAILTDVCYQCK